MTEKEIVQALRYCSDPNGGACRFCRLYDVECCHSDLMRTAADTIERMLAEMEELRK